MARSIGIDIGAYSVKVGLVQSSFRASSPDTVVERAVPGGAGEDYLERAFGIVGEIVREHFNDQDSVYLSVGGDQVHSRVIEFPFKGLKRTDLERAIGGELEQLLPFDMEDIVFAFDTLPRQLGEGEGDGAATTEAGAGDDDDEPTFVQSAAETMPPRGAVAAPASGMRVFACAMQIERARELLALAEEQGIEIRGLLVRSTCYARIAERVDRLGQVAGGDAVAVIDIGHAVTNVCVVHSGRTVFSRSIVRGGRDVTMAIASAWKMSVEDAERAKHEHGYVASMREPALPEDNEHLHGVVAGELGPIAREIRRTLLACRAETGATVTLAALVGGGSRLRGTASYLSEQLDLDVFTLDGADAERIVGPNSPVPVDVACAAAGVAFDGTGGRPTYDLRTGELALKADFSFLRAKAAHLAAVALIIVAFAAGNAYAALYQLRQNEAELGAALAEESVRVLGSEKSAEEINESVGPNVVEQSPIPKMTAYDVLLALNEKLPAKGDVTLNVETIDITPGKIKIDAQAATSAEIDRIKAAVAEVDCFADVTEGSISSGANDVKVFSLSARTTCRE